MERRRRLEIPNRRAVATARFAVLAALVLLLTAAPGALAQTGDFEEPPTSPEAVDDGPAAVAAGDFNQDLNTDLAVASAATDAVSILLGDGTGEMTPAPTSPEAAGDDPSSIATGDFNGDPHTDLAIANSTSDDISILLGDGTGDMTPSPTSPEAAGNGPRSVAIGDFNDDGHQDLAVARSRSDRVAILLGDGAGDFVIIGSERTGELPVSVALGDFNADGKQDLATANRKSDDVTIRRGEGTGDFKQPRTSPVSVGAEPTSIGAGDFNGDGSDDLAVSSIASGKVTIMLAVGSNGNFDLPPTSPEGAGTNPSALVVGDLDSDGFQDLAIANFFSDDVTIRRGDGTGNFKEPPTSPERAGNSPLALAAGDLDGDDLVDLAVANFDSDDVTLLLNTVAKGETTTCRGERATMVGTSEGDELIGTNKADVIVARGGKDLVRGRHEDDVVCGNGGDDDLRGGDGGDDLYGNEGEDSLDGGDGDDVLRGGPDRDVCTGGPGGDDVDGCG